MLEKDFSHMEREFVIGDDAFDNNIAEDVQIDPADLDYEFLVHAERYAYYGWLAEHAKAWVAEANVRVRLVYAAQDFRAREIGRELAEQKRGFRMTEKMIENEAYTSKEHMEALRELNRAKYIYGQLENCKQSMIQRQFMLKELGANARQEGAANPVLLREHLEEKAELARERGQQRREAARAAAREAAAAQPPPKRKTPPVRPGKAAKTAA